MSKKKKNNPQQQEFLKSNASKKIVVRRNNKRIWYALFGILLLTLIVYLPSLSNDFVSLDDELYIKSNPLIRHVDLKLFFSTLQVMGNYHPLVMLVYSIIYSAFQLDPKAYHFVNLCIHLINTALVLFVIFELTDILEIAVIVSLLFGIHPMHVESVAWISELKDLMYASFFLASLFYYIRYVKNALNKKYFILSIVFFIFSVLSKGMGVSLSILLLLVDFFLGRKMSAKIFIEKIPFLILSVVFGMVAIKAQQSFGSTQNLSVLSIPQRLVFACYGFITYLWKLVLPVNLSAYYPYPTMPSDGGVPSLFYFYPVIFVILTIVICFTFKKSKKIILGIGFYAITVGLVLQLIPVGGAIIADRYTYIPSIGIFLLFGYGLYKLFQNNTYKTISSVLLIVMTLSYSVMTYQRIPVWKDGMTLMNDILSKGDVALAYYIRGLLYQNKGETENAISDYSKAVELYPEYVEAYNNRGLEYSTLSKNNEALKDYNRAIEMDGKCANAYFNRGNIFYSAGDHQKAFADYDKSIRFDSTNARVFCNRANIYYVNNDYQNAIRDYSKAIQLDATLSNAFFYRGAVFEKQNRIGEACNDYRKAAALGDANAVNKVNLLCK